MDESSSTEDGADRDDAAINAGISKAASEANFAERLAERGLSAIVMDGEGRITRRWPDGRVTTV